MQSNPFSNPSFRIGVLGGGQLGKMLSQAAGQWDVQLSVLDRDPSFPAGIVSANFVSGNFKNYEDVVAFGQGLDVVTIEIETINTEALATLESMGKIVHPCSRVIDIIRDKGRQKQFYRLNSLPTAAFGFYDSKVDILAAVENGKLEYPFVQKARREGYDGRGVQIIRHPHDLNDVFDVKSLVEACVDIELEIGVTVARNASGEIRSFPPVAMAFHPTANLVEYLYCPSGIGPALEHEAIQIAQSLIEAFDMCGLLAVELFLTRDGKLLINEVAPRPHNSGHHTIESCNVSQYQQHLLAICNLPLVEVEIITPAVMVNLLGHPEHTGRVKINGVSECLNKGNVHFHFYGKNETRPFRKMGHATILADDIEKAKETAHFVKNTIQFIT